MQQAQTEIGEDRPVSKNKACKVLGVSNRQMDKAIAMGQAKMVEFAGRPFMTPSELKRLKALLK